MNLYTSNSTVKKPSDFYEDAARVVWLQIQTNPNISQSFILAWMLRASVDAQNFKKEH